MCACKMDLLHGAAVRLPTWTAGSLSQSMVSYGPTCMTLQCVQRPYACLAGTSQVSLVQEPSCSSRCSAVGRCFQSPTCCAVSSACQQGSSGVDIGMRAWRCPCTSLHMYFYALTASETESATSKGGRHCAMELSTYLPLRVVAMLQVACWALCQETPVLIARKDVVTTLSAPTPCTQPLELASGWHWPGIP
jgi:hypothetical protein